MTGEEGSGEAPEQARGPRPGPTPQGPGAAGPGDAHGVPPDDAPGPWGTGQRPFDPEGAESARDPDKVAAELLARSKDGPPAVGDAGPEAAGSAEGKAED